MKMSVALTGILVCSFFIVLVSVLCGCSGKPVLVYVELTPLPHLATEPLRLTEVLPYPADEEFPWIELHNQAGTVVNPKGQRIAIDDKWDYTLPESLIVPRNGFVLLVFDSTRVGRDTATSPGDSLQVFYLGREYAGAMGNRPGFIVSEFREDAVTRTVDFVAWGASPPMECVTPDRRRFLKTGWFIDMVPNTGVYVPRDTIIKNHSIGVFPRINATGPGDWAVYDEGDLTPGVLNPVPRPWAIRPENNATRRFDRVAISWHASKHVRGFEIQVARDTGFSDTVITSYPLSRGYSAREISNAKTIWYRVRSFYGENASRWSDTRQMCLLRQQERWIPERVNHLEGFEQSLQFQRKDSPLLCLDGCATDLDYPIEGPWDIEHPNRLYMTKYHGSKNCARASISMIATYYGGRLSQDRIAYHDLVELCDTTRSVCDTVPEGDLGHDVPMYCSNIKPVLNWALGYSVQVEYVYNSKPSFDDLMLWIDSGQAILTCEQPTGGGPSHATVIIGYKKGAGFVMDTEDTLDLLIVADPLLGMQEIPFDEWQNSVCGTWVCPMPKDVPTPLVDSSDIRDLDGDGLMDFDEEKRFHTDSTNPDSDYDCVWDKNDIRGYVIESPNESDSVTVPNVDMDSVRKELDADNDNDGILDGQEDSDRDGLLDDGETSAFIKDYPVPAILLTTDSCRNEVAAARVSQTSPSQVILLLDRSGSTGDAGRYQKAIWACRQGLATWFEVADTLEFEVGLIYMCNHPYFDTVESRNTTLGRLTEVKRDKILISLADSANAPSSSLFSVPAHTLVKTLGPNGFDCWRENSESASRVVILITDGQDEYSLAARMDSSFAWEVFETGHVIGGVIGIDPATPKDTANLYLWADRLASPEPRVLMVGDTTDATALVGYLRAVLAKSLELRTQTREGSHRRSLRVSEDSPDGG